MSCMTRAGLIALLLTLVVGSLLAMACGSSKKSTTIPRTVSVTIKDFEFTPATVTIKVGDTVTWTNNGPSTHTVTADDGSFASGNLWGDTFSHTFQTVGTFTYHCAISRFMTGTVIVR